MVNSCIHVVMYSYYALAAMGPTISKYLWWKKYLTIMQLVRFSFIAHWKIFNFTIFGEQVQFTTALIMGINGIRSGCDFPLWMQYALVMYMMSFIVLFGNFYVQAYIEKVQIVVFLFPDNCTLYIILLFWSCFFIFVSYLFKIQGTRTRRKRR